LDEKKLVNFNPLTKKFRCLGTHPKLILHILCEAMRLRVIGGVAVSGI